MTGVGRGRRFAWTIADQGLSSISNFGLGLVVARSVGAQAFGAFALAYTTYVLIQGVSRGATTDPLLVRHSALRPGQQEAIRQATATATAIGVVGAGVLAIVALLMGGELEASLLALAVGLPGLLLQDSIRFAFFALAKPVGAVLNDLLWVVVQVGIFWALAVSGRSTAGFLLVGWGAAATVAAVVGLTQLRLVPRMQRVGPWLRVQGDLALRFVGDSLATMGSQQLTTYVVAGTAGLAASGSLRAAMIVLGPIGVLFQGTQSAVIAEGARFAADRVDSLRRLVRGVAVVLPCAGALWVVALVLTPRWLGRSLLGDTWTGAHEVLPYMGAASCLAGILFAANSGLRALGDAKRALRSRLTSLPVKLAGGVGGGVAGGAVGAAVGIMISDLITAGIWWHQLRRSLAARMGRLEAPLVPAASLVAPIAPSDDGSVA